MMRVKTVGIVLGLAALWAAGPAGAADQLYMFPHIKKIGAACGSKLEANIMRLLVKEKDSMQVSGWTFQHDGGECRLEVYVNDSVTYRTLQTEWRADTP